MIAGAAKVEITPACDVWMDGMIRSHRSVGVHDPLYARALFLCPNEDRARAFVVVSVDVCALRGQDALAARQAAAARTGVPAEHIIVAATHTHSGPATMGFFNPVEEGYVRELVGKIAAVIEQAVNSARPAAAGCGLGREDTISHYRRLLADDGHVVMNWEPFPAEHILGPLGVPDTEVGVLAVADAQKPAELICLLFNHAGHPNVMSGENYLLSADYPGYAARLIEKQMGCTAIFTNGAQGSVDIDGLKDRDWAGVARAGGALAESVIRTARSIAPSADAHIRGSHLRYSLAARGITDDELAWAEAELAQTGGAVEPHADGIGDDYKAALYKQIRESDEQDIEVEQTAFAVDDAIFISFPSELFAEIGANIKAESRFEQTCIIGLANGCVGYVPTHLAVTQGGYEVDTRRVSEDAEDTVLECSHLLTEELFVR